MSVRIVKPNPSMIYAYVSHRAEELEKLDVERNVKPAYLPFQSFE